MLFSTTCNAATDTLGSKTTVPSPTLVVPADTVGSAGCLTCAVTTAGANANGTMTEKMIEDLSQV